MQAAQTADLCDVSFTNRRNDRLMMIDLHQAVLHVRIFGYLDQEYLLKTQKTSYGYACFTNHKDFYQENCPGIVVENGNIDELILMMTGGYQG